MYLIWFNIDQNGKVTECVGGDENYVVLDPADKDKYQYSETVDPDVVKNVANYIFMNGAFQKT